MPKKLGTCPKSLEARERRAEKKKEEKEKKERELEEAYWKDDDKHVNKKLHRKVFSLLMYAQVDRRMNVTRKDKNN